MTRFCRTKKRKYVTEKGFLSFARKYRKQVLNTGLDAQKTASIKVVHKAAKATGESVRNKTEDAVTKWKVNKIVKLKPVIEKI